MLKDLQNPSQQSHEAAKDIAQPEVRGYIESLDATPDTTFPNFSQEKVFNFSTTAGSLASGFCTIAAGAVFSCA